MDIIFEDSELYVIDKPSGLLSVPGKAPENKDSVLSRLQELGEAHCAHRLDMSTSGLMVVAKNKKTLRALHKQFAERNIYKRYRALVQGLVEPDEQLIEAPIRCDWPNRPKQMICPDGKKSTTRVSSLEQITDIDATLLELEPVTGRSHQLRVHLQYIDHPILGCEFYAPESVKVRASQLCLHARELGFQHPGTEKQSMFKSEIDFMPFLIY